MASLKSLKGRARSLTPGMPKKLVLLPSANTSQSYCTCCPSVKVMMPPEPPKIFTLAHGLSLFHSDSTCAVHRCKDKGAMDGRMDGRMDGVVWHSRWQQSDVVPISTIHAECASKLQDPRYCRQSAQKDCWVRT